MGVRGVLFALCAAILYFCILFRICRKELSSSRFVLAFATSEFEFVPSFLPSGWIELAPVRPFLVAW